MIYIYALEKHIPQLHRYIHKYHSPCDTYEVRAIQGEYFVNQTSQDGELMLLKTMTMRCWTSRDGMFPWESKGSIMANVS